MIKVKVSRYFSDITMRDGSKSFQSSGCKESLYVMGVNGSMKHVRCSGAGKEGGEGRSVCMLDESLILDRVALFLCFLDSSFS